MPDPVVYADSKAWICSLTISDHFEALTEQERWYAHWLSRASFAGARIIFRQNAYLAEDILDLIIALFEYSKGQWQELALLAGITNSEMNYFLYYAAEFLSSYGYFTAHSSQKFLPQLSAQSFQKLASVSDLIAAKFRTVADVIYSDPHSSLGLPDSHNGIISNYYPGFRDLDKDQLSHIQDALNSASIASENTRLSRVVQASGAEELSLLVASADKDTTSLNGTSPSITLEFGDHSSELTRVISSLQEAIHYSATQEEKLAITSYIKSFQTGSIFAHKKALGHWVKDRSPVVETLLGFIEYYRDPASVRAEWRGFVMIKNKAESEVFARLAAQANKFLALLPWSRDFEEREFMTPDFTSMEALTLVSTTMPAGTSGPNYEDVKRECGFKNISIRNRVVESSSADITFLEAEDKALYARYAVDGFGVIVAFHELIGHGSGKCFTETSDGQYNFDRDNPPINPLNGQAVKTWYKKGQTAKSIFGSSYEECRAECIALYLALQSEAMELFTYADVEKDDVVYVGFLYILRAGLLGLKTWNPTQKTWARAHPRTFWKEIHIVSFWSTR